MYKDLCIIVIDELTVKLYFGFRVNCLLLKNNDKFVNFRCLYISLSLRIFLFSYFIFPVSSRKRIGIL